MDHAGTDHARRAARPVVLCAALGVAAFAVTFGVALALGRGLAGSALAALLLPLALSGALAVGLGVGFLVAVVVEQPYGLRRMSRVVPVATPLAVLVALFVYAADPAAQVGAPETGAAVPEDVGTPRTVTVAPPATPVTPVVPGAPDAAAGPTSVRRIVPVAAAAPAPVVVTVLDPGDAVPPRVLTGGGTVREPAALIKGGKKVKHRHCGARHRGLCRGRS